MAYNMTSKSKVKFGTPKNSFDGGGMSGQNQLLAYMISQQKGQGLQQQLGKDAVMTGGVDRSTGGAFQTQAGQDMDVSTSLRKKASEDTLKLQQALPILDDLEKSYIEAYQGMQGERSGITGAMNATKEYGMGVLLRQNQSLRNFIDKVNQYEAPLIKLSGDVGNFSGSERESARAGVPKATPNLDINRMFMPDDPEFGLTKIQSLKKLYASKYQEAYNVAETGQLSPGYADWAKTIFSQSGGAAQVTPPQNIDKRESIKQRIKAKYGASK